MGPSPSKQQGIQRTVKEQPILVHSNSVRAVAFSPNGERIATSSFEVAIIWLVSNGEILRTLRGHSNGVWALAWSPSGERLITGSLDGNACIWRSGSGTLLQTLKGNVWLFAVAWSPTGKNVVTASQGGILKIWQPTTGKLLQTTQRQPGAVYAIAFSPDGKFIITGSGDKRSRIFLVTVNSDSAHFGESKPLWTLEGHSGDVRAVAWSPTGDLIATGSLDKSIRIWKAPTGDPIQILNGHSEGVYGIAWSPSGNFIISGSHDQTAIIWSATTGEAIQTLKHHTKLVNAVAWSSKGGEIATTSDDRTARIIPIILTTQQWKFSTNDSDESKLASNPPSSSFILKPPSNSPKLIKAPPPPPESPSSLLSQTRTNTNNVKPENHSNLPSDDRTVHSSELPQPRCFENVAILSFDDALTKLLLLRECPTGRPDLANKIPNDDSIASMKREVNTWYVKVQEREEAKQLIAAHGLAADEVKAILCYSMGSPYSVYTWLNGWLITDRRDELIKEHVGPFFVLLYRALEKLPLMRCKASRGILVRNIKVLRDTFDNYKTRCQKGSTLSFWGLASFSTDDNVPAKFAGGPEKDAIIYSCKELECVSIRDLSRFPKEEEVLPMPPCAFEIVSSCRNGAKLMVDLEQVGHDEIAYVLPKKFQQSYSFF